MGSCSLGQGLRDSLDPVRATSERKPTGTKWCGVEQGLDDWMPRAGACSPSGKCSERSQRAGVAESIPGSWKQFLTGWLCALVS